MTSIYLAGKIAASDWRHTAVPRLRGQWEPFHPLNLSRVPNAWPVLRRAVTNGLDYAGPYFISDDHACAHGTGTHGCATAKHAPCIERAPKRNDVRNLCFDAIQRADIFFAWLDGPTAHGTLVEIGYARALRKHIIIASPQLPDTWEQHDRTSIEPEGWAADLWFAFSCASVTLIASTPLAALEAINS